MSTVIPFRPGKDYTIKFDTLAKRLGLKRPFVIRNLLSLDPILIDDIEDKAKNLFSQMSFKDVESDKNLEKVPEVITIRLDNEQERRFNALVESLGAGTKVQVLRNLLSGDPRTVATICKKAKSIPFVPKEVKISGSTTPGVKANIEITDLNAELFQKKSQEVFNSEGHGILSEEELSDAIEELVRKKVFEFEKELRSLVKERGVTSDIEAKVPCQEEIPSAGLPSGSGEPSSISRRHADSQTGGSLFPKFESENNQTSNKTKGGKGKKQKAVDHSEERREIMDYFNFKADRNLSYNSADSIKAINTMLDAGKTVKQFMTIIDNMCYWWKDVSPEVMYGNLFPRTIFKISHWDEYLAKVPKLSEGPKGPYKPPLKHEKYKGMYS